MINFLTLRNVRLKIKFRFLITILELVDTLVQLLLDILNDETMLIEDKKDCLKTCVFVCIYVTTSLTVGEIRLS